MIEGAKRAFYAKLILNSAKMPKSSRRVLYERLEVLRLDIAHRARYKINLLILYGFGLAFCIMDAAMFGECLAIPLACGLAILLVIIVNDINEMVELEPAIDKLKDPADGVPYSGTVGPFWF